MKLPDNIKDLLIQFYSLGKSIVDSSMELVVGGDRFTEEFDLLIFILDRLYSAVSNQRKHWLKKLSMIIPPEVKKIEGNYVAITNRQKVSYKVDQKIAREMYEKGVLPPYIERISEAKLRIKRVKDGSNNLGDSQ